MALPELLTALDGHRITTAKEWEEIRRPEIMKIISENLFGYTPQHKPDRVLTTILEEDNASCGGKNNYRKVRSTYWWGKKSCDVVANIYVPKNISHKVPAMMMVDPFLGELHRCEEPPYLYSFFPPDFITDRGYAAVQVVASITSPDDRVRYKEGVLSAMPPAQNKPEGTTWGCIGAWAWATSRVLDYLMDCDDIDGTKVAVSGCSRAGKTALWCGAQDERIAVVMSNVSGTGGAAIIRGKVGEHISDIVTNYPFWFCPNYQTYAQRVEDFPMDHHFLMAMAAPRPGYLASASEDIWADIDAEYLACTLGSEAYKLYDKPIALPEIRPESDKQVIDGYFGYHLRPGGHDLTPYDWKRYMDFCDKFLK